MEVRAWAPLRISFAGGGTDVPPYPTAHGGAVLSSTIGRYATASVRTRTDHDYRVESLDMMASAAFGRDELAFDGYLDLVKAVLRNLAPARGLDLTLATDAPPGSGLGSSSALVVAMLAAIGALEGHAWSPAELAWRAYQVERIDLRIEGGMQDQYAAAFGGLNLIKFHGDGCVDVRSLRVAPEVMDELERSLLLAWCGHGRTDSGILRRQVDGVRNRSVRTLNSLATMKELVQTMSDALLKGDLAAFAEGLNEGWEQKRRLASGITTPWLDELYEVGRRAGAAAGKVTGAGGGGFLLFMTRPTNRDRVAAALKAADAPCTPVRLNPLGVHWAMI
jgi:D-glycero-alpha-D-manno-heptose-7-phosphate kinase